MAISAGSVFVDLGARLDKRDFERYDLELKKVREKVARKEQFKAQLGGDFDNRAFNAYERQLKTSQRATDEHVKATGKLRTAFGTVWGRGGAAFAAVGGAYGLVTAVKSVTGAYQESQISQKQMQTQLKALGISYQEHAKTIDDVIQKTSRLAGIDDEDLQNAFTNIVRATGKVNESLKLTALAADIARARHMDVVKAGQLLGKVAEGNVTALTRYGIVLTKSTKNVDDLKASNDHATKSQLEAAAAADKQANAQSAVAELQRRFGGQAAAYGRTQAGSIDRLNVAWENLRETLGKNLAPALTNAANKLAIFLDQMNRGVGTGGKFRDALKAVGDYLKFMIKVIGAAADDVLFLSKAILAAVKAVFDLGSHLPGVGDKFKGLSNRAQNAMASIDNFRDSLHPTQTRMRDLGDTVSRMSQTMSTSTHNASLALTRNFKNAADGIGRNVGRAKDIVDHGMEHIQASLSAELKQLGVPGGIKAKPLGRDPVPLRAAGGWIGAPGQVGHDTELALLAPGEAVLNRHQQAIVEGLLGDGFLDRLFSTVNRPHYLAKGGRVAKRFASGGISGAVAAANQLDRAHFPYRWGGGHQASPAPFGPVDCSGAVSYVLQHAGVNIPTMVSGQLASAGQPGPGALTVFANPVHTFMRIGSRYFGTSGTNPGGGAGWMPDPGDAYRSRFSVRHFGAGDGLLDALPKFTVTGTGALTRIAQAAMNRASGAANSALSSIGLGTGDNGDPGPIGAVGGKSGLAALWRRAGGPPGVAGLMAAIAMAESGGNPRAHNPSGASGLWQILGVPFPGNPFDPLTNARMAVSKYRSQGLGAWEAYTNGAYRQFLARGGRVHHRHHKPAFPKAKLARGWEFLRDGHNHPKDFVPPGEVLGPTTSKLFNFIQTRAAEADVTQNPADDVTWAQNLLTFWTNIYHWTKHSKGGGSRIQEAARNLVDARGNLAQAISDATPAPADTAAGGDAGSTTPDPIQLAPTPGQIAAAAAQDLSAFLGQQQALITGFGSNYVAAGGGFNPGGTYGGVRGFGVMGGSLGAGNGGPTVVIGNGGSFARFATAPDNAPTLVQQLRFQVENGVGG